MFGGQELWGDEGEKGWCLGFELFTDGDVSRDVKEVSTYKREDDNLQGVRNIN